MNNNFENRKGV